jgi:hypothetical protein
MPRDDFRRQADAVRAIPLEVVLTSWGAKRDRCDRSRWQTPRGPLSVSGTKFFNWHASRGGGGAIDLAMHLGEWDARQAIEWLRQNLLHHVAGIAPNIHTHPTIATSGDAQSLSRLDSPSLSAPSSHRSESSDHQPLGPPVRQGPRLRFQLPAASHTQLPRVRRYLSQQRGLSTAILTSLIDQGKLYADARGNAVFVMQAGKPNRPIGAELRGTGQRVWRGLASGTSKNAGFFWIGDPGAQHLVLCESAIDAISCHQFHAECQAAPLGRPCLCISTAGVRPDAPWLSPLLARGYHIYCGFDADERGDTASHQMLTRHQSIQRLRPAGHDWNDVLTAASN